MACFQYFIWLFPVRVVFSCGGRRIGQTRNRTRWLKQLDFRAKASCEEVVSASRTAWAFSDNRNYWLPKVGEANRIFKRPVVSDRQRMSAPFAPIENWTTSGKALGSREFEVLRFICWLRHEGIDDARVGLVSFNLPTRVERPRSSSSARTVCQAR